MADIIKSSITDIPRDVKKGEKDNFGIEPYEKGLIHFINNTSTPITVALQGEWGSGKTSLMNSLKQNLSDVDGALFHSIWLNTWEFALMKDAEQTLIDIITGLIKEVSKIAKTDETQTKKIINKLWGIGKTTAKFAAKTAADKVVSGSSEIVDGIFSGGSGESSISEIREDLENIIEKCIQKDNKKGFVFFIDDLDRIDPPVAVALLELLKNIFTLKNCVFVLAIDYDVVVKGLEDKFGKLTDKNEREFRSFFDKIIQVPFSMPVTSYRVNEFLRDSLLTTNYLSEEQVNNEELISELSTICNLTVGTNPRALKRLLNSLSLISYINKAKGFSKGDDSLNEELELIVNFSLVSIQIAYPQVYRLLSRQTDFDKWDNKVALQMNLKELDALSKARLETSEEFDEEWEQVLFRLCESDIYLKKKALNISRLLNKLKKLIIEKGEDVGNIIGAVISLSSVTSLEAFDQPVIEYHKGTFIKDLRYKVISKLKSKLPEYEVNEDGKRVRSNAGIKVGDRVMMLSTSPWEGKVCVEITSSIWISEVPYKDIETAFTDSGFAKELEEIKQDHINDLRNIDILNEYELLSKYSIKQNCYAIDYYTWLALPQVEDFSNEDVLNKIADIIAKWFLEMGKLRVLDEQLKRD